jgi:hypothetical protein
LRHAARVGWKMRRSTVMSFADTSQRNCRFLFAAASQ